MPKQKMKSRNSYGQELMNLLLSNIIIDDMFASVNYCLNLANGIGTVDDIDHLGNRRVRCVGETSSKPIQNWSCSYGKEQ